jgi:O-acetyl-ADP-ribose deacetylase (regulator of RNase III)
MNQYQFQDTLISIVLGDITEETADAIVNAANNHLWLGGGVAGAIKHKGGEVIEQEALAKGPIEIGEAVFTSAGRLKAKYVIHATVMGQDLNTDEDKIKLATQNSLKCAEAMKLKSIAFPALGTGVGGFPIAKCAEIMITEVVNHINKKSTIKKLSFVLFDQPTYAAFERELNAVVKHISQ